MPSIPMRSRACTPSILRLLQWIAFLAAFLIGTSQSHAQEKSDRVLNTPSGIVRVSGSGGGEVVSVAGRDVLPQADRYVLGGVFPLGATNIVLVKQFNDGSCCNTYSELVLLILGPGDQVLVASGIKSDEEGTATTSIDTDRFVLLSTTAEGKKVRWTYANGKLTSSTGVTVVAKAFETPKPSPQLAPPAPQRPVNPPSRQAAYPTQGPRDGIICQNNPAACDAIQRNENIRAQVLGARCRQLLNVFDRNTPVGQYQLEKAGCI